MLNVRARQQSMLTWGWYYMRAARVAARARIIYGARTEHIYESGEVVMKSIQIYTYMFCASARRQVQNACACAPQYAPRWCVMTKTQERDKNRRASAKRRAQNACAYIYAQRMHACAPYMVRSGKAARVCRKNTYWIVHALVGAHTIQQPLRGRRALSPARRERRAYCCYGMGITYIQVRNIVNITKKRKCGERRARNTSG